MSVRGEIAARLNLTQTGTGDLGTPKIDISVSKVIDLLPGTDAVNKANLLFSDTRTLAASATENLDLSGLLVDAFGATFTAAEILAIFVSAAAANTNNVQISVPATNGFFGPFLAAGDGVAVKKGEWQLFASGTGWAVTAGTGDLLTVTNSGAGTAVTYDVVIVGRTVAA